MVDRLMISSRHRLIIASALLLFSTWALAEYKAVGKIEGNVCWGFVIESCKFYEVHAVQADDGQPYSVTHTYENVSEYSQSKGRCWINTKSRGGGVLSWLTNAAVQPQFYTKNEGGEFEEIDVEYLTFRCIQR